MTRQEAADELMACGLDAPSLTALLKAIRTVNATGWGVITVNIKACQVDTWEAKITGKIDRERGENVRKC